MKSFVGLGTLGKLVIRNMTNCGCGSLLAPKFFPKSFLTMCNNQATKSGVPNLLSPISVSRLFSTSSTHKHKFVQKIVGFRVGCIYILHQLMLKVASIVDCRLFYFCHIYPRSNKNVENSLSLILEINS